MNAKFLVLEVKPINGTPSGEVVTLTQIEGEPMEGELVLHITDPAEFGQFKEGREADVCVTPAE